MNSYRRAVIKGIVLSIICCGALLITACGRSFASGKTPVAVNGVIDLTEWDFEKQGTVKLNGSWEFYWNRLLEPKDFAQPLLPAKTGYFTMPGSWNDYETGHEKIPGQGYGTFRLTVRLGNRDGIYGLKTLHMATAYRMWVDGALLSSNGTVGTSRDAMVPQYLPKISMFRPKGATVPIVLQVSNFYHRKGGPWEVIEFGTADQIIEKRESRSHFELFIFGALLIMAVYHFALYLFRTKDKSPLYFGIVCLAVVGRLVVTGERFFISLFPSINWEVALKTEYICFYLFMPLFMMYFERLFPGEFSKPLLRISQWLGAAFILFVIVTPASVYSYSTQPYQVITIAFGLYLHYITIRAIMKKREGAILVMVSGEIFFITAINDFFVANEFYYAINLVPLGLLVFITSQSIILSRRFSSAFSTVETQSEQLKINEEELWEKNVALENSDRIKDMFLANTSHELRTPLHGMIGLSESMLEGSAGALPPKAVENLSLIASSGHRLAGMVNDLLDMAKIQDEGLSLNLRPLDLRSLGEMVVRLSLPLAGVKPLEIINGIRPDLPAVQADEDRIRQVLHNLVGNAIKFTNEGRIELSARVMDRPDGEGDESGWPMIEVAVSDTGIGVPEEYRKKIFEAYQQVDGGDARAYAGTGLGLAIAKRIVELHGGAIRVEPNPGGGSVFSFTLPALHGVAMDNPGPVVIEGMSEAPGDGAAGPAPLSGETDGGAFENNPVLLVVDDDPVNVRVLQTYFESKRCTVKTAMDGISALDLIDRDDTIELVLLDIMMPVMSGYEVCRRIRATRSAERLPVVMLTAKNMMADIDAAFEAGANDYIVKPFRISELHARVGTMLKLRNVRKTAASGLTIRDRNRAYSIAFSDIIYITSSAKNIVIHTGVEDIEVPLLMKEISERLPPDLFIRIHKSHIINRAYIHSISHVQYGRYRLRLRDNDDTELPVGRAYAESLLKKA
ncbi:MAG: response regulator [Spirochaetes bacterium]|nr:response regulator [Spirochaetota bacterium]